MIEARGYYETNRYDLAFKRCEMILSIDPYNKGARDLEERIEQEASKRKKAREVIP